MKGGFERMEINRVYGSPLHLRQIFLNIYGNCIKYNKKLRQGGNGCQLSWHCGWEGLPIVGSSVIRVSA